jgi:hypothetical protein
MPITVPPPMWRLAKRLAKLNGRTIGGEMSLLIQAEWNRRTSPAAM